MNSAELCLVSVQLTVVVYCIATIVVENPLFYYSYLENRYKCVCCIATMVVDNLLFYYSCPENRYKYVCCIATKVEENPLFCYSCLTMERILDVCYIVTMVVENQFHHLEIM